MGPRGGLGSALRWSPADQLRLGAHMRGHKMTALSMIFKTSKYIVGEGSVLQAVRHLGTVLKFLDSTGNKGAGVRGQREWVLWRCLM